MVEVSRDGNRVYFTNSLYGAWDDQFYPDGVGSWMAKLDVTPAAGSTFDERFFPEGEAFRGRRTHQVRLQGGTRPATPTASPRSPDRTSRPMLSLAGPYQRSQCTTSSNGRRSGRAIGASGRSAG